MRVFCEVDFLEADLVADFFAEPAAAFEGNAFGEEPRGEAARLQDDDFAVAEQPAIEQDLRHLGRFSGAGRRLQDQARPGGERPDDLVFEFVDREIARLHAGERNTGFQPVGRAGFPPANLKRQAGCPSYKTARMACYAQNRATNSSISFSVVAQEHISR